MTDQEKEMTPQERLNYLRERVSQVVSILNLNRIAHCATTTTSTCTWYLVVPRMLADIKTHRSINHCMH